MGKKRRKQRERKQQEQRRQRAIANVMSKVVPRSSFDRPYQKLLKLIRRHNVLSIVTQASLKLHEMERMEDDDKRVQAWGQTPPWLLMLLIRWAFEHGDPSTLDKPSLNYREFVKAVNLLHDMNGAEDPFLKEGGVAGLQKFLRTLAFQQFWYSAKLSQSDLGRQGVLFRRLPEEHWIQRKFRELTKLSISEFLEIAFILWASLDGKLSPQVSAKLFDNYSPNKGKLFFDLVSLAPSQVSEYLKDKNRKNAVRLPFLQMKELTPLTRYPLLRLPQFYWVYSRRVFEQALTTFIYDVLKAEDSARFGSEFGPLFEAYVRRGLEWLGTKFYDERDLARHLGGKTVDFLLPYDHCTVLIEVKATEIKGPVQVNPANEQLMNELKSTVIKATVQGMSVATTLNQGNDPLDVPARTLYYLLIVTYREHYLGSGMDLWSEFLEEAVTPALEKQGITAVIVPPERIAILSATEFDHLISLLSSGAVDLPMLLASVAASDRTDNLAIRKFSFGQHLHEHPGERPSLPYLYEEVEALADSVAEKVRARAQEVNGGG